ncbi:oxidoreductase [Streptomyces noursei]|uniref:Oxidoreductase n=1 Tax=Streptomyces noursei TaxID=1971 RepID=A0A401RC32_STRNR|nr:oxidoreductase [Streptomyces noursei]
MATAPTLSFQDLLDRPLLERDITMTCVSNEVGGPYVGTARWLGVRLAGLLHEAGVRPPSRGGPADQLVARSVDGMTIGTPVTSTPPSRSRPSRPDRWPWRAWPGPNTKASTASRSA